MRNFTKKWLLVFGIGGVLVAVVSAVIVVLVLTINDTSDGNAGRFELALSHPSESELGRYASAAVSTDAVYCSDIANGLLKNGSSVADAAIGGLLCMGVVHPHSLGIGGGFLLVMYNATTKETKVLNAREVAPAAAHEAMFEEFPANSTVGGLAVGVPGEVKGYWELHRAHGHLPWRDILQPTITLCREGFNVTKTLASALEGSKEFILQEESLAEIFVNNATGRVWVEGDIMTRPKLAETLEILADRGGDAFYNGELAERIISDLNDFGGNMTVKDLENYRVEWGRPIELDIFGGFQIKTVPPPGSGVLLAFMLRVLGGYLPRPTSMSEYATVYQRIVETFKYAYAKRSILGDPNDYEVTQVVEEVVALLKSESYAREVQSLLLDRSTSQSVEYYGAQFDQLPDDHGTAHLSVVAANGDAIAVTSTINLHFGAKRRSMSTGIIFNNEMDDFSSPNATNSFGLPPSVNNFIRPGKRPMSSMCPAIFTDTEGRARLVVGAAGGTKITTSTALVSLRNLWLGMDIKEAMDESRIHHQLYPMEASTEEGFDAQILGSLGSFGHKMATHANSGSIVGGVERLRNGTLQANFDFRKSGSVAGY